MHSLFVRQIFCRCQCHFRRCDTFNRRVIRQIHEQHSALDSARPAEVADKVIRFLIGDADSAENDGEAVALAQHARLTRNLRRQLCVRQTRAGEHRQLLPANQRVQTVNGGNARLDKFTTVIASLEAIMKNRQAFLKLETCDKNKNNTKSKCYIDSATAFPFSFFRGARNMEKIHYGFETSLENLDIHNFIPSPASELQGNISGKISADFKGINPSKMNFKASANISAVFFVLSAGLATIKTTG